MSKGSRINVNFAESWSGRWESNPRPNGGKRLNVMASFVGRVKVTRAEYPPDKISVNGVGRLRAAILKSVGTNELRKAGALPCRNRAFMN